jgi:hypothetical protein
MNPKNKLANRARLLQLVRPERFIRSLWIFFMPFSFPPQDNLVEQIKADVERAKGAIDFNIRLRERIIDNLRRYGIHAERQVRFAQAGLRIVIEERLNPEIQRIILSRNMSGAHPYYQMPSLKKHRRLVSHGNVSLFNTAYDKGDFEDDIHSICAKIYDQSQINLQHVLKIKTVAITNLLIFFVLVRLQIHNERKRFKHINQFFYIKSSNGVGDLCK